MPRLACGAPMWWRRRLIAETCLLKGVPCAARQLQTDADLTCLATRMDRAGLCVKETCVECSVRNGCEVSRDVWCVGVSGSVETEDWGEVNSSEHALQVFKLRQRQQSNTRQITC